MKFKTQFDSKYKGSQGELNSQDSCTLPNDCLSLRQLMVNHTRNIASGVSEQPLIYTGDVEIPVFTDLNDIAEYKKELKQQEAELKKQLKKEQDEKQNQEAEKLTRKTTDDSKEEKGTQPSGDEKTSK